MTVSKELLDCFEDVKDSVNAARAHYQIWFTLRGKGKAMDEYLTDMNDYRYVDFFHAANIAHYKLMFIEAGCIFDCDDRANRLRKLKNLLNQHEFHDLAQQFENKLEPYRKLVSNILTIRSKLIAHKEIGVDQSDLFRKHAIKPDDIKALLNTLAELMRELEKLLNGGASYSSVGVTDRWEKATFGLLAVLRMGRHS